MLHLMRRHAGSWLIKVVLGVIVVVFVFWGVGSYRARKGNRVAIVNGQVISSDEYRGAYKRLMEQYREQFGDALDQKLLKSLNLKKQTLEQLINRRLLLQEAGHLELQVGNDELLKAIQGIGAFHENGRFSSRQYRRTIAANRMTPEVFEQSMKEDLLAEKMRRIVLGSIKVSDEEALETFKWREEMVSIEYMRFEPSAYKDVKIAPEEIESYFSSHKKAYEIPPKIRVGYVRFGFKAFESQANISDNDIKEYFELNKETYATPKKVRARHILFRIEPGSTQEQRDELRNKAWVLMEQARSGKDFAKLAKEYSDDPGTKNKGGDLGYFAKDRMVKPFSDAAFAMKSGEISEPVLSRFGWHIIKVEAIQKAKEPVITDVEDEIRNKLVKKAARKLAYDRTEEFYDASYGVDHIADVAKGRGVEVLETAFFARNDRVDGIKEAPKFAKVAFDLDDNETSEPLELTDGYYILEVIGKNEAKIPELSFVEEKVYNDLTKVTQNDLARKDADKFLKAVKDGAEFKAAAKNFDPKVETTDFFKRFDSVPGIGREQDLVELAFSLSKKNPLPERAIKGRKDYYVIRSKKRQDADVKDFEAKKSQIKSGIISEKRQELMNEWFAQLRRQGEVSIQEGFLD